VAFYEELRKQRWDDHRLYHHSRINQTLHLISALTFISCYMLCFINPTVAALIGWTIAMWLRQVGHFFFEPKDFDDVNNLEHAEKERIKVGYNLRRKVVLLAIWASIPVFLLVWPTSFGVFPDSSGADFWQNLGTSWMVLAIAALAFRTIQLWITADIRTGVVWFTKILTDPFHDLKMYYRAPLSLARGELIDPMLHARQ
jgi:hypothetical protein